MGSPGPDKSTPREPGPETPGPNDPERADPGASDPAQPGGGAEVLVPGGLFSPRSALPEGERLLMLHKPAAVWVFLRTPGRLSALVALLAGLLVWGVLLGRGLWGYGSELGGLGLLLLAMQLSWNVLSYEARWYAVTERRLMVVGGVLGRFSAEMPLDSVRAIVVVRPWLERLLGVGSVGFGSAATGGLEVLWVAVPGAERVADRVRSRIGGPEVTREGGPDA